MATDLIDVSCGPDGIPCPSVSPGPPGSQGPAGTNGTNGTNGLNAFCITQAAFTVPAISGSVLITVDESGWVSPGQFIYIQNAGFYTASSVTPISINATNLGVSGNAPPGNIVAAGQIVSPSGPQGVAGNASGSVGGVLTGTLPNPGMAASGVTPGTFTKLTVTVDGRVTVGANLVAADVPNLAASQITSGTLAIAQGGTNSATASSAITALSPQTTKGDLLGFTTLPARIPVGMDGYVLTASSAASPGVAWVAASAVTSSYPVQNVANGTYVMAPSDVIIAQPGGGGLGSILLLGSAPNGRFVIIKSTSATTNMTIQANSGDTIEGAATLNFTSAYGVRFLYYDFSSHTWFVISAI